MQKYYPLYLFFVVTMLAISCQNEDSSSNTSKESIEKTVNKKTVVGKIPVSTSVDSNWVRMLQGVWVLETNEMANIEIDGNTYNDRTGDMTNSAFRLEYSNSCTRCQTELELSEHKCLAMFNKKDETVRTCLLVYQLSATNLELISIKHPDAIHKYKRK